jgi:uncharacterized spore protein YtfJ
MDAHTLLSRVKESLSVRQAFGEPIERDGIVVIPVAFVAGGGGGGEGPVPKTADGSRSARDDQQSPDAPQSMGSGGGLGGVVVPLGVYVVKGNDVTWKPVLQPMLLALPVIGLLRLLVKRRARSLSR